MPKYPDINTNIFNKKINNLYDDYTIKKQTHSFDKYCNPKEYTLQLPQQFLSHYINPHTQYTGVLIYHKIGAGKTCASIQIAEKW